MQQKFTVNQLATLTGISVRTLHHYDQIGLLRPGERSGSNYRYYGQKELLRLQQILLYRELDIPLSRIAEILDDPEFDVMEALARHKEELKKRKQRMTVLINTVESTIEQLKKRTEKMDYNEMYKGFSREQAEAWQNEAEEKWGKKTIADSHQKILSMNKGEWEGLKQKADDIYVAMVNRMLLSPADAEVQALVREHFEMTGKHFDVTIEIYRNLGTMYVEDERFTAYYDKYKPGLASFLRDAIHVYCDNH